MRQTIRRMCSIKKHSSKPNKKQKTTSEDFGRMECVMMVVLQFLLLQLQHLLLLEDHMFATVAKPAIK